MSEVRRFKLLLAARQSGELAREHEAKVAAAAAEARRNRWLAVEEHLIPADTRRTRESLRWVGIKDPVVEYHGRMNCYRFVSRGKPLSMEQLSAALAENTLKSLNYVRLRRREWFKERAARDPIWRLNRNTRHAVNMSLNGAKRGRRWQTLVGYTIDELKAHLEAQFVDGMSWENIGKWHVDHIRPLSSFKITGPECPEFKVAWALSNLQPLWASDNLRKSATWRP